MKLLVVILVISIIGNFAGLFVFFKFNKKSDYLAVLQEKLKKQDEVLVKVNKLLPRKLVFLHHSVGKNWLQDGLRGELMAKGISVQSITYGDDIGEETDMNHWVPKFKNNIEEIFNFGYSDTGSQHDIVMFKSCYPNSDIVGKGNEAGDPYVAEKTITNYQSVFDSLKNVFSEYPQKQFIYITSPPLYETQTNSENAARAREFTKWIKTDFETKYKTETGFDNFIVFDLFDILANDRNVLKAEFTGSVGDSHPNLLANQTASQAFVKFLDAHEL